MVAPARAPRFVALDAWRGIAALGIVFYHIGGDHGLMATAWHGELGRAVDLFFVLSGFVIASAYAARLAAGFRLRTFMWLRLGRVWPLHMAVLTAFVLLECLIGAMGWRHGGHEAFTDARSPFELGLTVLLLQGFVLPGASLWHVQSWSISIELVLYALAALVFRFGGRGAVWLWAGVALGALLAPPGWVGTQVWLQRGLAGFGLGVLVWALRAHAPPPRWASAIEGAVVAGLAPVLACAAPLIVADLLFAALVWTFAAERGAVSRLLHRRAFTTLGTLSYALYMVHGFVLGRCFDVLNLIEPQFQLTLTGASEAGIARLVTPGWASNLLALAMIAVCLGAARLAWASIEDPARRWSREQVGQGTSA